MLELKPERAGADDFLDCPLFLCGKEFRADMTGALYWPSESALVAADLHLEKGTAFAAPGQRLPPYDIRATLERLARAIDRHEPQTVVVLDDSLLDPRAAERIGDENLEILALLQEGRDWIWITGGHGPAAPGRLGGVAMAEIVVEGLALRRAPRGGPVTHEIAGHMHPAALLVMQGYAFRRRCFVGNGRRLVLPAFGAYAGGLNVLEPAFAPIFGNGGLSVWMLGQEGLYPVASRLLRED